MTSPGRWLPATALAAIPVLMLGAPVAAVFPGAPPPPHTGGFGEPTCAACHFDVPEPDPADSLAVSGLPDAFVPGACYRLTVTLRRPGMERGGFEMAARTEGGEQAGAIRPVGVRTDVSLYKGIDYTHQTQKGSELAAPNTASWQVEWTAPAKPVGAVHFDLAGNAADGDESQFGDHVYTTSLVVPASA